ncbi:MAG: hypothetical protein ABIH23_21165 [bacterium]
MVLRMFFRQWCMATCIGILILFSGCATVNRVVNLPFRAANNVLNTSERTLTDPNALPRAFNKGLSSSSQLMR